MTSCAPSISGHTTVVGIIGWPVAHSLSPAMHNAAFAAAALDYCYVPLPVPPDRLKDAVAGLRAMGLRGVNVTVPHKQAVIPFLDELSGPARLLGAVNTIVNDEGMLRGENTDGFGFMASLREETGFEARGTNCAVIGTGGAGRALAFTLALEGAARLVLVNRPKSWAEAVAREMKDKADELPDAIPQLSVHDLDEPDLPARLVNCDLIVNSTSLGMHEGDPSALPAEAFPPGAIVCDIVYTQPETLFSRLARERGCRTVHGLGMLLHQGARAFELWTGQKPDVEVMRSVLKNHLFGRAR
ncbi:MAG: shikimate dehydrogenase [Candidatus Sumerlaeia bacterium]